MKKKKILISLSIICCSYTVFGQQLKESTLPYWVLGGFERPEGLNPIISPISTTIFNDPNTGTENVWVSNDTFNPTAAIKGSYLKPGD